MFKQNRVTIILALRTRLLHIFIWVIFEDKKRSKKAKCSFPEKGSRIAICSYFIKKNGTLRKLKHESETSYLYPIGACLPPASLPCHSLHHAVWGKNELFLQRTVYYTYFLAASAIFVIGETGDGRDNPLYGYFKPHKCYFVTGN